MFTCNDFKEAKILPVEMTAKVVSIPEKKTSQKSIICSNNYELSLVILFSLFFKCTIYYKTIF